MSIAWEGAGLRHANGHEALAGVSIAVAAGERVAVIGPSGAGKTSLLRLGATSLRPTAGGVRVLGEDPWALPPAALRRLRARVGLVHQAPPIPPRLRVVTAVLAGRLGRWSLGRSLASLVWPVDAAGAQAALAPLDLADRLFDRCDRLSGGQLQRVGIARVLYQSPELILADEPVSALDPAAADRAIGALVAQSHATGAAVVASLHAVDVALRWFPRIVALRDGRVHFDLPASAVTPAMLSALYEAEGGAPPVHRAEPVSADSVDPDPAAAGGGACGRCL